MKVLHLLAKELSAFDRKCARLDREALEARGVAVIEESTRGADAAHLYGKSFDRATLRKLRMPFVMNSDTPIPRGRWLAPPSPAARLTATATLVPEPVDPGFFAEVEAAPVPRVGTFRGSRGISEAVALVRARIERFRTDLEWHVFEFVPSPAEMLSVGIWLDPASDDRDLDGLTAEAVALRMRVVATATPMNHARLAGGAAGFLVPPGDWNEMAHAVVTSLFKPEVWAPRAAAQLAAREAFTATNRGARLVALYRQISGGM